MCLTIDETIVETRKSWINYTSDERKKYLLHNLGKTDCEFMVTSKSLRSFKWILSDVSLVFRKMFEQNNISEATRIEDITAEKFELFLSFIHRSAAAIQSVDDLFIVYDIGQKYEVNIDYVKHEMTAVLEKRWKLFWFRFFNEAYSRDDAPLISVFEAIFSKQSLPVFDHYNYVSNYVKMPTRTFAVLLNFILVCGRHKTAVKMLDFFLEENSRTLSNLEKDVLRELACSIVVPKDPQSCFSFNYIKEVLTKSNVA